MTQQITQPPCGFFGATVRADRIAPIDRDLTPRLAETERYVTAMADDPVLAALRPESEIRAGDASDPCIDSAKVTSSH